MKVPIVSIVGKSDSGKTTLIEKLLPALERRGLRVGTVKHDVHSFDMDHPGKDTYRHFAAGARQVIIVSPEKVALIRRTETPMSLDEALDQFSGPLDLIVTEGYKKEKKPKIEVFRPEVHAAPLCGSDDNRIALVTDADLPADCPKFGLNDVEAIADFIVARFVPAKK